MRLQMQAFGTIPTWNVVGLKSGYSSPSRDVCCVTDVNIGDDEWCDGELYDTTIVCCSMVGLNIHCGNCRWSNLLGLLVAITPIFGHKSFDEPVFLAPSFELKGARTNRYPAFTKVLNATDRPAKTALACCLKPLLL